MNELKLLELRARLLSAVGELTVSVSCTICGATITGPHQASHRPGCSLGALAQQDAEPWVEKIKSQTESKPRPASKPRKNPRFKTGDEFRRPDGTFDRSAWAKANLVKPKKDKTPKEIKSLGLPASLGGIRSAQD